MLVRRDPQRISENPLQNKPQWIVILRTNESITGFIVSYRAVIYRNLELITISVVGVNRARILDFSETDGVRYCSGTLLRDVDR